jgi:two-component system, OmpR family, response regulator RegX3
MKRIALVEDDSDLAFTITLNLQREGYTITHFGRGHEALVEIQRGGFDFVILDLNLPDLDGLTICRELRRDPNTSNVPILMLTARGSERDRITGLELGADDYLTKPFSPRELVARVRAVLRRAAADTAPHGDVVRVGDLTLDVPRMRAEVNGRSVELTATEFALLATLARQPGRIFTRSQLLDAVHGVAFESYERAIDTHIKNIRRKLEPDPRRPTHILTVYGVGYRMADDRL